MQLYMHIASRLCGAGGYISALTSVGWYTWTIGTPPSWTDIGGKLSFSKLDASRTGVDQGNYCYYDLHAAAMQLAFPGRDGLVPPIDSSNNTKRSAGNVVETILGICTALFNDYLIFSVGKKKSGNSCRRTNTSRALQKRCATLRSTSTASAATCRARPRRVGNLLSHTAMLRATASHQPTMQAPCMDGAGEPVRRYRSTGGGRRRERHARW